MQPGGEWGKAVDLKGDKGDSATLSGLNVDAFAAEVARHINSYDPAGW
jgi:hypothetical protein